MDDLDWESFIANVESSAPKADLEDGQHRCEECDAVLEEVDGDFICPNCSVQATNILQLEQTDIYCDDSGRIFLGQAVDLFTKRSRRHQTDYGWAWSTDDAIVHILSLQIESLEKLGLVPEHFRACISNMWFKFWLENVAPFIRDEYNENDLIPFKTTDTLKTRDIEVLIKVRDKVMIPQWACRSRAAKAEAGKSRPKKRRYTMMGTQFQKDDPNEHSGDDGFDMSSNFSDDSVDPVPVNGPVDINELEMDDEPAPANELEQVDKSAPPVDRVNPPNEIDGVDDEFHNDLSRLRPKVNSTRNVGKDNVNILTLNRTLAFIEATARLIDMPEPLFASDIIRVCTQRLIPFYGAQKALPEKMRYNYEDRLLFKATSPPSTNQLTRATSFLIHKVYKDKLPLHAPVPNFTTIVERFVEDMNLPKDILEHMKDVDFSSFKKTSQVHLPENKAPTLQHYDRWAFAILACQLKKMFSLDDESLSLQTTQAQNESESTNRCYFIAKNWLRQLSIRLRLIMSHDPYALHHPMVSIKDLAPSGQVFKYIEATLSDRSQATTRLLDPLDRNDATFRNDLTEFLKNEIPRPRSLQRSPVDRDLEKPTNPRHPLQDSFRRTQHLWMSKVQDDEVLMNLIFKNFANDKVLLPDHGRRWSIYETTNCDRMKMDISPEWPYFFRLLLHVGAYICFCDPKDLLREVRFVEEYLYAGQRYSFKLRNIAVRVNQRNQRQISREQRISQQETRQEDGHEDRQEEGEGLGEKEREKADDCSPVNHLNECHE